MSIHLPEDGYGDYAVKDLLNVLSRGTKSWGLEEYESQKNKSVRVEGEYKNGLKNGIWTEWYECNVRDTSDTRDFVMLGLGGVKFTSEDSIRQLDRVKRIKKFRRSVKLVTNYKNGVKEGKRIGYNKDDKVILECSFKKNKLNGLFTEWNNKVEKIYECNYTDGIRVSVIKEPPGPPMYVSFD